MKIDECNSTLRITRQSIKRGSHGNISKDGFVIVSSSFPQCDNRANIFFVEGRAREYVIMTLDENSYAVIGKAFTTIIFPSYIAEGSCFRYTTDIIL